MIGCFYRNNKKGTIYVVDDIAIDCNNGPDEGRQVVVYHSLSGGDTYVRSRDEFVNKFTLIKTRIISAFPGCGKTYATSELSRIHGEEYVSDSDSSGWGWSSPGVRNPDFPGNYLDHICNMIGTAEVIFISTHLGVRQGLESRKIPFTLVYPENGCASEYLDRYKQRGSPSSFLDRVMPNFIEWVDELKNQRGCRHHVLGAGKTIYSELPILMDFGAD